MEVLTGEHAQLGGAWTQAFGTVRHGMGEPAAFPAAKPHAPAGPAGPALSHLSEPQTAGSAERAPDEAAQRACETAHHTVADTRVEDRTGDGCPAPVESGQELQHHANHEQHIPTAHTQEGTQPSLPPPQPELPPAPSPAMELQQRDAHRDTAPASAARRSWDSMSLKSTPVRSHSTSVPVTRPASARIRHRQAAQADSPNEPSSSLRQTPDDGTQAVEGLIALKMQPAVKFEAVASEPREIIAASLRRSAAKEGLITSAEAIPEDTAVDRGTGSPMPSNVSGRSTPAMPETEGEPPSLEQREEEDFKQCKNPYYLGRAELTRLRTELIRAVVLMRKDERDADFEVSLRMMLSYLRFHTVSAATLADLKLVEIIRPLMVHPNRRVAASATQLLQMGAWCEVFVRIFGVPRRIVAPERSTIPNGGPAV